MSYIDKSNTITVDAILTDIGRARLAEGKFNVTKFALTDDDVDYRKWNNTHPSGSAYFGEAIEALYVTQPVSNANSNIVYRLANSEDMTGNNKNYVVGYNANGVVDSDIGAEIHYDYSGSNPSYGVEEVRGPNAIAWPWAIKFGLLNTTSPSLLKDVVFTITFQDTTWVDFNDGGGVLKYSTKQTSDGARHSVTAKWSDFNQGDTLGNPSSDANAGGILYMRPSENYISGNENAIYQTYITISSPDYPGIFTIRWDVNQKEGWVTDPHSSLGVL